MCFYKRRKILSEQCSHALEDAESLISRSVIQPFKCLFISQILMTGTCLEQEQL